MELFWFDLIAREFLHATPTTNFILPLGSFRWDLQQFNKIQLQSVKLFFYRMGVGGVVRNEPVGLLRAPTQRDAEG